ncbi:hypothetical protein ACSU64_21375 [Bacillaceae bacterium C204]|uniref:hypothetical protein n=1 Tax=Neobacillus sp. 204 TaxID=3383351 RepID=UPI00397991EA
MNLNEHIGILIRNTDLAIANYVKKKLEPFNLAPEQNLIMMILWKQEGISPNEFVLHLNKDKGNFLAAPGVQAKILPPGGNEVLIGSANQKFDEQTGQLVDEGTLRFLDSKVDAFINFVKSV